MEKNILLSIVGIIILIAVVVFGLWSLDQAEAPRRAVHNELASCLEERGAIFYGAFWCPACAQQKALFNGAVKNLPYLECSNPDRTTTAMCEQEGITSYPTWKFSNGVVCNGVTDPEVLAHLTGCMQPRIPGSETDIYTTLLNRYLQRQAPEHREQLEQQIQDVINTSLQEYGTTIETETDTNRILDAWVHNVTSCTPNRV